MAGARRCTKRGFKGPKEIADNTGNRPRKQDDGDRASARVVRRERRLLGAGAVRGSWRKIGLRHAGEFFDTFPHFAVDVFLRGERGELLDETR